MNELFKPMLVLSIYIVALLLLLLPSTGRSDPQISATSHEGNQIPRRCSNPSYHSSSPQMQARQSPPSGNTENQGQGGRPPRSPNGQASLLRAHRQTWDGHLGLSSGSQCGATSGFSQNHIGPVR